MTFSSDRRKAAALVALVFVLGIAFGIIGVLVGRRVLGAGNRANRGDGDGNGNGNGQGQQITQLMRELNLSADQERDFHQTLSDTRDRYDAIRKSMDPQFSQVRDQNRDRIRGILTDQQRPLFEDFLRQSRNRRNDNSGRNNQNNRNNQNGNQNNRNDQIPSVKRLTQELSLTSEQQTQLSTILRDTRASLDALREQMNPQFEEARLQDREKLRQILNAGQRPALDAFFQRRDEEHRRR